MARNCPFVPAKHHSLSRPSPPPPPTISHQTKPLENPSPPPKNSLFSISLLPKPPKTPKFQTLPSRSAMVVPLGPGKFYGTSLPRPRIYTDIRFSDERVDPPTPVLDPLLSWASEAHWSMGGLSFTRLRLQGRIEGSVSKLRSHRSHQISASASAANDKDKSGESSAVRSEDSPPPAPIAAKRRRFTDSMIPEDDEDEFDEDMKAGGSIRARRRRLVKKLGDEFDRVASEKGEEKAKAVDRRVPERVSRAARRQILDDDEADPAVAEGVNKVNSKGKRGKRGESGAVGLRSSPRLAKRG